MIKPLLQKPVPALMAVLVAAVLLIACEQDNAKPNVNPTIEFRTEAGYTYVNDTIGMEDTLLVGVIIRKGDDGLNTFKVQRTFDTGPTTTQDSLSIGSDEFEFDKVIISRAIPGTEKWTFWVQETDGDVIRRSLTFIVQ